jgi:hypothetical protein
MKTIAWLMLASAAAWAQSGLSEPQIGFMLDAAGTVRRVAGIAGSLIVRGAVAGPVLDCAFSGALGVAKLASSVVVVDASGKVVSSDPAPAGHALFGFSRDLQSAVAYYPSAGSFALWRAGAWLPLGLDPEIFESRPLAIGLTDDDHIVAIVERGRLRELVRVRISDGAIEWSEDLPESGAVLLLSDGSIVDAVKGALVLRNPQGTEMRVELDRRVDALLAMGPGWVEAITAAGPPAALSIGAHRLDVFSLPEATQ